VNLSITVIFSYTSGFLGTQAARGRFEAIKGQRQIGATEVERARHKIRPIILHAAIISGIIFRTNSNYMHISFYRWTANASDNSLRIAVACIRLQTPQRRTAFSVPNRYAT
jgi:hypothetical protein